MRNPFNNSSSKKKEEQQQQKEGGNNNSGHSPVGAAGRAVAGLTAAAVGALPRALFRTFSGNNVSTHATGGVEVKSLAFSRDGSLLACGGEDGVVRLLTWPALSSVAEVRPAGAAAASTASSSSSSNDNGVRDLDFGPCSTDGKAHLLAVVLDSGAASVWRVGAGVSSAAPLATLPPPPRPLEASKPQKQRGGRAPLPPRPATLARLRFDRSPPPATVRLVAAVNHPSAGGFLAAASARATSSPADPGAPPLALSWSPLPALAASKAAAEGGSSPPPSPTKTLPPLPPKKVLSSPITAFDLSACGKLVGAGSSDGDVVVARCDDLGVVAATRGRHMVFVTAVSFSPSSATSSPSTSSAAAAPPPLLLSVSADASAALTRAPASALLPRSSSASASCKGCAVVVRTLLAALLALLVLLLFLAEAAARHSGGAACRAPAASAANPLAALLRSLGLSSSPHRLSPREHLEGAAARIAALASSKCWAAVAERLRAKGPGALFLGGGGDGEL